MASLQPHRNQDGSTSWTALIRLKGLKSVSKTFRDKAEATAWAEATETSLKAQRDRGNARPNIGRATIRTVIDAYLDDPEIKSLRSYDSIELIMAWWLDHDGDERALSFGVTKLREARDQLLAQGKAPGTVNRHLSGLRACWNWARAQGYLPADAAWPTKLQLTEPPPVARFLTEAEAKRLLKAVAKDPPWFKAAVVFALTTGMRQGEQLSLTWRDVDLDKQRAYVMRSKTGRRRAVHLPAVAVTELRNIGSGKPGESVFPCSKSSLVALWRDARQRAGIENCRWHDLRHSCASWLAQNGASLMQVAEQLGHTSLAATKRYAFLIEGEATPAHTAFERLR